MKKVPELSSVPRPMGPYSVVTEAGGLVFVSGQLGIDPNTGEASSLNVRGQTVQIMSNVGVILRSLDLDFDDIVKTTIYLADIADSSTVNDVYGSYFTENPPARSAVQAGALPGDFLIELEVIVAR